MDSRQQIALKERPFDLGLAPEREHLEVRDPRNEAATEARWQPVLERLDIEVLGIRDVPTQPVRVEVHGVIWEVAPMESRVYHVPESVYHRIRAAEAAGIPFAYWVWGEEQFARPTFQPTPEREQVRPLPRGRDPIVVGIIPTAPNRGVWCLLGLWFH